MRRMIYDVYMIKIIWVHCRKNTSESDPRSYEVTNKQLQIKPRKKFWGSNGIRTHDLRDTGATLYQLS